MKKKHLYTKWAKLLVVAVLSASSLLAGFAGMRIVQGLQYGMTIREISHGTSYEQSSTAASYLYTEAEVLMDSWQTQNIFCSDGTDYDEEMEIDITNLSAGVDYPGKNPDTTYVLADLAEFYGSNNYYRLRFLVDSAEAYALEWGESEITNETEAAAGETAAEAEAEYNTGETAAEAETEYDTGETATEPEAEYDTDSGTWIYTDNGGNVVTDADYEEMGSDATVYDTETVYLETDSYESDYTVNETGETGVPYRFKIYSTADNILYNNGLELEEESILAVSGTTLAELARSTQDTNSPVSLEECYALLIDAADQLNDYFLSQESVDTNTNAMLYLKNTDTGEVYTNISSWQSLELREIRNLYKNEYMDENGTGGLYFSSFYDEEEKSTALEWEGDYIDAYGTLLAEDAEEMLGSGTWEIYLALDTTWPLTTSSSYTDMQVFQWWTENSPFGYLNTVFVFFAALALSAVMLILLSCQTGYRQGDADIHPAPMDRFPIEIMVLMDIILWFIPVYIVFSAVANSSWYYYEAPVNYGGYVKLMIAGAVGTALGALLIAWELKRYGRRVKERSVGGSLILKVSAGIRKLAETTGSTMRESRRSTVAYAVFLIVQFAALFLAAGFWWRWWGWWSNKAFAVLLWAGLFFLDVFVWWKLMRRVAGREMIKRGMKELGEGNLDHQVDAGALSGENREMAEVLNSMREAVRRAVEVEMKSERLKTDLITNVSHDIKTPLTSIINYVDILKRECLPDERIAGYIDILDQKSQRLKQLTEDLVEASKISSGVITLDMREIDLKQLIIQATGEFDDKLQERNLQLVLNLPEEEMRISADGRRMYRVIENLLNNAVKYAMPGSRIYVAGLHRDGHVIFEIKNMSEHALNFSAEELMERFVRGDISRTTEGSGLGLEIAKNLTTMQGGELELYLDGDLFKVTVTFRCVPSHHREDGQESLMLHPETE
ncbi:MAG: ATP-binding protein [Clostridiales bacterium]|nr:ATP-binding protein [Clostridiales bacterium]